MTTWADAHRRAAVMAAEVHGDLHTPLDSPVDVFGAIERLGLVLAFAPLGHVSGLYLPNSDVPGILLHEGHPRTRQRYTAGHELGHHVFGHAAEVDGDLELELQRGDIEGWPDHEKEAEAFGAWFLMPRRLLRKGLQTIGVETPSSPYDVYALSLWLGTSYTATARQLATTRLVSRDLAEKWARIPPRTLKLGIAGDYAPDDLRNDVWWLTGNSLREPIEARPGDRLVLMLDETPSTGFSWEFRSLPSELRLLADSYKTHWEPQPAMIDVDPDVDGAPHPRCFVLEVSPGLLDGEHQVGLVKERTWEGKVVDEFQLRVRIKSSLHGVQLQGAAAYGAPAAAERELALTY